MIVKRQNVNEAAKAMIKLINDESLRKRMGEKGRMHVVQNYSWEHSIKIMESVYEKVLNSKTTN